MELRCAPLAAMVKTADFGELDHRSPFALVLKGICDYKKKGNKINAVAKYLGIAGHNRLSFRTQLSL